MSKIALPRRWFSSRDRPRIPAIENKLIAEIGKIISNFKESKSFQHALSKGENREVPIREFFVNNLPKNFDCVKGELVDLNNNSSPQLDCIIYDKNKNIPFAQTESVILPSEAALACISVKSLLNKEELSDCLKAVSKLKSLKPYNKSVSFNRVGGEPADDKSRYLYVVFAQNFLINTCLLPDLVYIL